MQIQWILGVSICGLTLYSEGPLPLPMFVSFSKTWLVNRWRIVFSQSFQIKKQYRKVLCFLFLLFAVVSTDGVNYLHQSPTHASEWLSLECMSPPPTRCATYFHTALGLHSVTLLAALRMWWVTIDLSLNITVSSDRTMLYAKSKKISLFTHYK